MLLESKLQSALLEIPETAVMEQVAESVNSLVGRLISNIEDE
jgi:hypothetical protein